MAKFGQALYGPSWRSALAHGFSVTEADIVAVRRKLAPAEWRELLIGMAQDTALRALEAANQLLWRDVAAEEPAQRPLCAPLPSRFA